MLDVLVVDDQPIILEIIKSYLEDEYNVLIATSGEEAFEIVRKSRPHLVLLDINMPRISGFEIAQTLLQDPKCKNIPIILMSADTSSESISHGFSVGIVDYITKPIEPVMFKHKVALWAKMIAQSLENQKKQQLLDEYKNTVDRSSIVSKTDQRGIITYVNEKFCEISGYSAEELLGKPHNIVRHPDMPSAVFKELWATIKQKKAWFGKVKNRKKNGEAYFVETVINPIIDAEGEVVEFIAVRHDITELEEYREILTEELQSTNKSFQENINYMKQYESAINSYTGVLKTNPSGIITYANKKFCDLMGYTFDELFGINCADIRDEKHKLKEECKAINQDLQNKKVINRLIVNRKKNGEKLHTTTLFFPICDLESNVVEHLQIMHDVTEIINLNEEIVSTQKEIIVTMGAIGETRSKETGLHVQRVAEYSYLLAQLAGLQDEHAERIKQASPMHDIGKVGIPDSILNKPGKLTEEEFELMKTHAALGYEMLKHSNREILQTSATIAYTHHEKYNGLGYPNGLKGEEIPIEGRITAVADVFDALGHDRVYKKAWPLEQILELFEKESGNHFDPRLIDLFFTHLDEFLAIKQKMDGIIEN